MKGSAIQQRHRDVLIQKSRDATEEVKPVGEQGSTAGLDIRVKQGQKRSNRVKVEIDLLAREEELVTVYHYVDVVPKDGWSPSAG